MKYSRIRSKIGVYYLFLLALIFVFQEANGQTVYVTKTGKKYHSNGCQYLRKSSYSMTLADATGSGYTACSRCQVGSVLIPKSNSKNKSNSFSSKKSSGSSQCMGTTKKGNRCSRNTKSASGYCHQHEG